MFNITRQYRGFSLRSWFVERVRRQKLRTKMLSELNDLRNLSDEHLRDVGLCRSEIERYVLDLYSDERDCWPQR